ncbi:oligosaccharide flippase family protein [bacterium]|nr:oligosaccharide flippase family protein [bacterium]
MFAHLKQLFKHSVVYGMSETISRGTGFILLFMYLRILNEYDIGIRRLVYTAAGFIVLLYTLGLDNAFLRYFMDKDYDHEKDSIFSTSLVFTTLIGLLFFASGYFFGGSLSSLLITNSSHTYLINLMFLILVFDTIVIYPTLVLRAESRLGYFSLISMARFILLIGLNIVFLWIFKRGLPGVFEANLVAVIIITIILFPVIKSNFTTRISYRVLKKLLMFGVPTIVTLFFLRIIDFSDNYLIEYFLGTDQVGFYAPVYTLGMVGIMVFVNSFRLAWQPFFISVKDNPDVKVLFSKIATYYAVFIAIVFLGMTLFREEIFFLYTSGKQPTPLSNIIPFVALAYVLYGFYFIMLAGVFIREKTKYLPIAPITGAVLNIGLNIVFIPRFGIIGAAYTTIFAYLVMVVILFAISRNVYHVRYEFPRLGAVFLLTAVLVGISFSFHSAPWMIRMFGNGILFILPPVVYWYSGFLKPEEISRIRQMIHGRFSR